MLTLVEIEILAVIGVNFAVLGLIVYAFRNFVYGLVQLRDDFIADFRANPDKYASFVIPVLDRIAKKMMGDVVGQANATANFKPIRITGNKGIDGLITMFISNKLMQQSGNSGTESASSGQNQIGVPENPFER